MLLYQVKWMKGILLLLTCFFATTVLFSQNKVVVRVEGIRQQKGSIMVGLFQPKETFLEKPAYGNVVPVSGESTEVIFEDIKSGEYGISIIHDINNNRQLDTNALGLPKEGFCFGNNAMGLFGPPSVENAKVSITESGVLLVIRMKYL